MSAQIIENPKLDDNLSNICGTEFDTNQNLCSIESSVHSPLSLIPSSGVSHVSKRPLAVINESAFTENVVCSIPMDSCNQVC